MAHLTKTLLPTCLLCLTAATAQANSDLHANDYRWLQFNVMHTIDQRPYTEADGGYSDTYLEMEFGGRSGMFELYGYVDIFDIFDTNSSDKHNGQNLFVKLAPRMSLNALTGLDLKLGPVQELYVASVNTIADGQMENQIGLGADVMMPWLGKVGVNLYARYSNENQYFVEEENSWNGYQLSANWFKPFYHFDSKSFLSYQGYFDYQFGLDEFERSDRTANNFATFHGLYWHSERFAVGYGVKYFKDAYGTKHGEPSFNGSAWNTSGLSHYIALTYKF
ncbi:MAG: outer membrane protein OmpK [Enterovibrio sp.]